MTSYYSNFDCSYNDKNQQTFYHDFSKTNLVSQISNAIDEIKNINYDYIDEIVNEINKLQDKIKNINYDYIDKIEINKLQNETFSDATYFINIRFPALNKIVRRTGDNNEVLVCETYEISYIGSKPDTKGNIFKYDKLDIGETTTFDIGVLEDRSVVKFNSFDFDRPVLLYYDATLNARYEYME